MPKTSLDWREAILWLRGYSDALAEREAALGNEHYLRGYDQGQIAGKARFG